MFFVGRPANGESEDASRKNAPMITKDRALAIPLKATRYSYCTVELAGAKAG